MKKLAILRCMTISNSCTGSGCLRACREKSASFARYEGEEIELVSFLHCNGCDIDPATDEGMQKKIARLQKFGVEVVHTSNCTVRDKEAGTRCPNIEKIVALLRANGIQTTHGTHRTSRTYHIE